MSDTTIHPVYYHHDDGSDRLLGIYTTDEAAQIE